MGLRKFQIFSKFFENENFAQKYSMLSLLLWFASGGAANYCLFGLITGKVITQLRVITGCSMTAMFGRDLIERISFGEKKGFLIWERFYASEYSTEDVP